MCMCTMYVGGGGGGGMVTNVGLYNLLLILTYTSSFMAPASFCLFYYKVLCNVSIMFLKLISLSLSHWVFSFFRLPMYFMLSYFWFPAPTSHQTHVPTWCYFSSTFHVLLFPSTPGFLFPFLLSNPHDTGSNHVPLYFQCY